jgi:hypothetical protein
LHRTGSVVLHEHYFANLGGDNKPGGEVLDAIKAVVRELRGVGGGVQEDGAGAGRRFRLVDPDFQPVHE